MLTAEHDGTTLEQVISDLQSRWGVPESPQEFRITIKVAEERNGDGGADRNGAANQDQPASGERPKREKAPPPRMSSGGREQGGPSRPRRRRRRRRRRGGGASS